MSEAANKTPAKSRRNRKLMAAAPTAVGPTDISDPLLRHEAKRAFVWIGMVGLVALAVLLAQPLLVIFGGMVFAAMVDGGARLLGRVLPVNRAIRVTLVLLFAGSGCAAAIDAERWLAETHDAGAAMIGAHQ